MNSSKLRVAALCLLPLLGCDKRSGVQKAAVVADSVIAAAPDAPGQPLRLASSAGPVAWLACEVVGRPCEAIGLVPPGASAHAWEPKPSDIARLQGVDAWLRTGLSFEASWTSRFQGAFPDMPVLDLRGSLDLQSSDEHGHESHGAEPMDPHVWASPRAMRTLAETLAVRLSAKRPDLAARIAARMPRVRMHLDSLDTLARDALAPWTGRTFLINHPGLGYLARDYGLVQMALESHGRELSPVGLFELRKVARAQGIKAVYLQAEASDRVARSVAADLGVPVVSIDLLATPWDSAFRVALQALAQGL